MNRAGVKQSVRQSDPMTRFVVFTMLIGGASLGALIYFKQTSSQSTLGHYIDLASIVLTTIGASLLIMVVARAARKSFRQITALMACGFLFQMIYMYIWYYYMHIADPPGMPDVSIGDFFYLGSYAFWTAATLPYLRRYGGLMSWNTRIMLVVYSVLAAIIVALSTHYWYDYALLYGYDLLTTGVWLSYAVVPLVCVFFFLAIALLYHYHHYGKGLLRYYWLYFLVPIVLIAAADILDGSNYVLYDSAVPGQYSDSLYLIAYSMVIASAAAILGSDLREASMDASRVQRGRPVSIDITEGRGYIVEDPTGARSFEIFAELISPKEGDGARSGYVLSREHPSRIRSKYMLRDTPITWIASTSGESVIAPSKASLIAQGIMDFLSKSRNGIVLFDGIESIILSNDFHRSVKMLEQLNDFVMQYRGVLLIPIDPKAFDPRELAVISRNFERIEAGDSSFRDMLKGSSARIEFSG
jgi:hypothetical protein